MQIGIFCFNTAEGMLPQDLAREVEDRGFESLWFPEHTHIPTSRRTPFFGGHELPPYYSHLANPFVGLSAAAATTRSLKLGTSVNLIAQYDPIILAKIVASLEVVSSGRVLLGVGFGWNAEELANHGVAFRDRYDVTREMIAALKALWTQDNASYAGRHVRFESSWLYPKPVQRPHPPVLLGAGAGPQALRTLIEHCDGWLPMVPAMGIAGFLDTLMRVRRMVEEAGRKSTSLEISPTGVAPDAATLEAFAEACVDRVILSLPYGPREELLPLLDSWRHLVPLFA